ncbi:hypothetical protein [Martelella sp. HB161492]|uniref:hypothetical protein n=1 Tax=Martelella sp. HB161492 TaxID=2720726 RepID=UPI00159076B4|nr:hypothetical protein [Martelella sp. HB161492]
MTSAEGDDRRTVRRAFLKFYRQWPTFGDDSDERAFAEWQGLSVEDRERASSLLPAFLTLSAMEGRTVKFAASTYLRGKRWQEVPDGMEAPATGPAIAATFGKAWMAERFIRLAEPCTPLPPLTRFQEHEIASGRADRDALRHERMQKMGWPSVNAMHEQALRYPGRGVRVSPETVLLGADFEQVRVGSALWRAWEAEHRGRGYPWLPGTGRAEWVYFPPLNAATPEAALNGFFGRLQRIGQSGVAAQ